MSNVKQNETNEDNSNLIDSMNNMAKEIAHSLKKPKYHNDDVKYTEQSSENIPEKRRSILDFGLPEDLLQNEKRNKLKNDIENIKPNVVMFDKRESIVKTDYNDLFSDDDNLKKVTNTRNNDFYDKKIEGLLKKEKKLETLRNKKKEEELSYIKNRPKINKLSQKINELKSLETKPIQKRAQEIVDKKYLKIDKLKQIYREIEDTECSKIISRKHYSEKKFEEWLNKQSKWESNKKSKIVSTKEENERLETENMKSMYHPNIDKKSVKSKILASETSSKNKESIHDKLYNLRDEKYDKIVQRLVESIPTFTPIINIHLPKFNKARQYKNYNYQRHETKNSENYMDNRKNHYNSVENSNKFGIIYEEDYRNIGNYDSAKNLGVNTSMVNSYYNPLNEYSDNGEVEEPGLIFKNRKSAEIKNNKIKNIEKKEKKKYHNHSYQEEEINVLSWQNSVANINKNEPNLTKQDSKNINLLYKINVRNSSAWDQNKENCIVYNPKNNNIKTSLIKNSAK